MSETLHLVCHYSHAISTAQRPIKFGPYFNSYRSTTITDSYSIPTAVRRHLSVRKLFSDLPVVPCTRTLILFLCHSVIKSIVCSASQYTHVARSPPTTVVVAV